MGCWEFGILGGGYAGCEEVGYRHCGYTDVGLFEKEIQMNKTIIKVSTLFLLIFLQANQNDNCNAGN